MERALHALHGSPLDDYEAYGPIPLTEIEHLMPRKGSPVRIFAAMGGLTGLAAGFGLAIGTALVFRLITGGKPPVSVLPFTVVGFELTILLAVLATFVTVLRACRLAPFAPPAEYDTRYSHETYGVHVRCRRNELDRARRILSEAGGEVADD
jgi:molybdopterin-containing oxidoreductase family membrane subunit